MAENPANETSNNTGNSVTPTKEKMSPEDEKMESQVSLLFLMFRCLTIQTLISE